MDENASSTRATLVVRRRDEPWRDRLRQYQILLDGLPAGRLSRGESLSIPIDPGPHTLRMSIDWCSSNAIEFEARAGGTCTFECGSGLTGVNPLMALFYMSVYSDKYLVLDQG